MRRLSPVVRTRVGSNGRWKSDGNRASAIGVGSVQCTPASYENFTATLSHVGEPIGCLNHWNAQSSVSPFQRIAEGTPEESWNSVGGLNIRPSADQAIFRGLFHGPTWADPTETKNHRARIVRIVRRVLICPSRNPVADMRRDHCPRRSLTIRKEE